MSTSYKPATEELKTAVREFMARNHGNLYMPIPHPDFADWPSSRSNGRFEVIGSHLEHPGGTVLDIGTHFGAFAHWLDDLGYKVTAVESSGRYAKIAKEIRDICGKSFEVIKGSVFDLEHAQYDIVIALNIFHHFLKTKEKYDSLARFLKRLDCKMMIFQAHNTDEKQMNDAYRNMDQDQFVQLVADLASLPHIEIIGHEKKRKIFKLKK